MIRVERGVEPSELPAIRADELTRLRGIAASRPVLKEDIGERYRDFAATLWRAQHCKCCYCEDRIQLKFHDVEHYRPKARADRRPGSADTYGYWWLALDWENLLFACPGCNRSAKNDQFPLSPGDTPLVPEERAPGGERPFLLDPAGPANPARHIQYYLKRAPGLDKHAQWWARPRRASLRGWWTIQICDLNRGELRELRWRYVQQTICPMARELVDALKGRDPLEIARRHQRALALLQSGGEFALLSHDALRHYVSGRKLAAWGLRWPTPEELPLLTPARTRRVAP